MSTGSLPKLVFFWPRVDSGAFCFCNECESAPFAQPFQRHIDPRNVPKSPNSSVSCLVLGFRAVKVAEATIPDVLFKASATEFRLHCLCEVLVQALR